MRKTFLTLAMSLAALTAFNASAATVGATAKSGATAVRCRNTHGRFEKCAPKPAAPRTCRDAKGKFASCKV